MRSGDRRAGAGQGAFERGFFAEGAAEDGVHQTAGAAGEVDGFIDRGVIRGAHVEDLVEPEAEDGARLGIDGPLAEQADEEIEPAQIA